MYIVISVSFIALIFTFLESIGLFRNGMRWGFILVTVIGAIHYNYGNDYMNYYDIAQLVNVTPFDFNAIMAGDIYHESGWVLLNYAFKHIGGFFTMVAVLNVFQNAIVFNIIKKEIPQKWWPIAVFIYLFETSFYLMSFTMMRQELVMIIFLGLWPWIKQRRFMLCAIILYLCSFIHTSAVILIPFAFWGFLPYNNRRTMIISFLTILILLLLNQNLLYTIFEDTTGLEKFSGYLNNYAVGDSNITFRLSVGFIINLLPVIICIAYVLNRNTQESKDKLGFVWMSLIGSLVFPFLLISNMMIRVRLYFSIFNILALPTAYQAIKNSLLKIGVLTLFIMVKLYDYFKFFQHPIWVDNFTTYHTIFEAL